MMPGKIAVDSALMRSIILLIVGSDEGKLQNGVQLVGSDRIRPT